MEGRGGGRSEGKGGDGGGKREKRKGGVVCRRRRILIFVLLIRELRWGKKERKTEEGIDGRLNVGGGGEGVCVVLEKRGIGE